ncbi:MAG: ATP-binding protein [Patescibacteria group bacterium]
MRKLSLSTKIALLFSLSSTLIIIATGVFLSLIYYYQVEKDVKNYLSQRTNDIIREHITSENSELLYKRGPQGETLSSRVRDYDVSVVIFDRNFAQVGTYGIYRNLPANQGTENFMDKALFNRAVTARKPIYQDTLLSNGQVYDTYTVPLIENNQVLGVMQVAKEARLLNNLVETNLTIMLFILPVSILLSWISGYLVTKKSFDPLRKLISYMQTVKVTHIPQQIARVNEQSQEIAALSQTFNQMLERIREGVMKQKSFIANASHELKTPLARALSTLELVEKDKNSSGDQNQAHVEKAREILLSLGGVIDSLLLLASVSEGAPQKIGLVQVGIYTQKILGEQNPEIEKKHLHLEFICPENLKLVMVHQYFRVLMTNLVTNAIKYNIDKGEISLEWKVTGRTAEFAISNTGLPVRENEQALLFKRFFRGSLVSDHVPGTGLGLAIVKEICHVCQLPIHIQQTPEHGVTIRISNFSAV